MNAMNDEKSNAQGGEELLQLVGFKVGDEEYGVDIHKVREINRMTAVTEIPNSRPYVDGVISLRGKVIPVVDLRSRLGIVRKEADRNTRIIVVELHSSIVGFVVDAVNKVFRIPKSVTEPPPALVASINAEYITAVGKLEDRLLTLLDLEKVLAN